MKTLRPHFVLSWVTHLGRVSHCVMRPPEASWISTPREDLSPPANTQDWHARDGGHPLRIRTSRLSQASAWWVSPPWLLQSQERTPIKNHSAKPPPNSWTSATVGNKCYNYWKTVTTTTPTPSCLRNSWWNRKPWDLRVSKSTRMELIQSPLFTASHSVLIQCCPQT